MGQYHTFRDWPKRTFKESGTTKGTGRGPKPGKGGLVINDPTDIPGVALWLDGSDKSSLYQTAGTQPFGLGSTAVTGTAQPVGCWADKSGNGYHMNQGDTTRRPDYRENQQNGLGAILGLGSSPPYKVYSTSSILSQDTEVLIFYVAAPSTNETSGILFNNSNTTNTWIAAIVDSRAGTPGTDGAAVRDSTGVAVADIPSDVGTEYNQFTAIVSGGYVTARLNGSAGTPAAIAGDGATANNYTRIFTHYNDTVPFIGHIAEMIVVDMAAAPAGTYSNATKINKWIQAIEAWQKSKWATP